MPYPESQDMDTCREEVLTVIWDGLVAFMHSQDLEATHHFYSELLQLPLYKDQGACRIYEVRPGSYVGFCVHFPEACRDGIIITLLTDDVDAVYERLSAEPGVEVGDPPTENARFSIYHFFASDPDGYKIEVQRFLD